MRSYTRCIKTFSSIAGVVIVLFWVHDSSQAFNPANNTGSDSPDCFSNYCACIPIVIVSDPIPPPVPEVDVPLCRWNHYQYQVLYIDYQWGDNLRIPGSPWRNAFEAGLSSWNGSSTPVWYYYNSSSINVINLYNGGDDGMRGWTNIICIVNGPTYLVEVFANVYYDHRDNYTVEQRRGLATHELGHGISIGHIPNSWSVPSLMYKNIPLFFQTCFNPQVSDIQLVNQIYP
jgi:hypothetical protein